MKKRPLCYFIYCVLHESGGAHMVTDTRLKEASSILLRPQLLPGLTVTIAVRSQTVAWLLYELK